MTLIPKYCWRITKYNPVFRDEKGTYQKDEWTAFSDIGKAYNGEILTFEEYKKIEDAYISTAFGFFSESNTESLKVNSLEKNNLPRIKKAQISDIEYAPELVENGLIVSDEIFEDICRLVLREV